MEKKRKIYRKNFIIIMLMMAGILFLNIPAHSNIVDMVKYVAEQSNYFAENTTSKIIEKANEYGYDDIDVIVRYGMSIKYPEGISVRKFDTALSLLDLALIATEKGMGYTNFIFRNRFTNQFIRYIPYFTGENFLGNLLIYKIKNEFKNYLENYNLGLFLSNSHLRRNNYEVSSHFIGNDNIAIPKLNFDVEKDRENIRELRKGLRYFNDSLSVEFYNRIVTFFPEKILPSKIMAELSTGKIVYSMVSLLNQYGKKFKEVNELLRIGAKFVKISDENIKKKRNFRIMLSIPESIKEVKEINKFLEKIPESIPLIAQHGVEYYKIIKNLNREEYKRIKPVGVDIIKIYHIFGKTGFDFVVKYSVEGANFLYYMNRPSSYMKRRMRMINFMYKHGFSSINYFFKLKLISPLEPIIIGILIIGFIFIIIYFHMSGFFVYSEFSVLPLRQKLSVIIILLLALAAFYWTLIENAKLLVENQGIEKIVKYHQPPIIKMETKRMFSTLIDSIENSENEYNKMVRLGYNFRTAEIKLFKKNLENLKSKYIVNLSKFEVKLISEPKLYTNYSKDKILSSDDLLLDLTFSIKNLDNIPKVFPLIIGLSTVNGNNIKSIRGHRRLSRTTFNPGVKDYFTITFPISLEDRPDKIVVKKEFLLRSSEKFIEFGPGTPLHMGDIFSTKEGLFYFEDLTSKKSGEVELLIRFLSSSNITQEVEVSDFKKIVERIFLVDKNRATFHLNKFIGEYPEYPEISPNEVLPFKLTFKALSLSIEDVTYIVINNKKILKENYLEKEYMKKLCLDYMKRIAAASEFEMGMYYLNPPIYRKWAKDVRKAKAHFEKALKNLPESEVIKNAVKLTNEEENNK